MKISCVVFEASFNATLIRIDRYVNSIQVAEGEINHASKIYSKEK